MTLSTASNQLTLDGSTPESRSIDIMRMFEPPEGYYLAFSGGKDSVVLYELAVRAGVKFDAHYSVTTIDPPEVLRFIRDNFKEVIWEKPVRSFFAELKQPGQTPPMRQARWCCEKLKECGGQGRYVLTGVRAAESGKRAKYGIVRPCLRGGMEGKTLISPLLHWTTEEVWQFIRSENLPYCSLYDEGFKRIGCIPCPFETNIQRNMERWPRVFDRIKAICVELYPQKESWQKRWTSGEDFFNWWISRDSAPSDEPDEQYAFDQFEDDDE